MRNKKHMLVGLFLMSLNGAYAAKNVIAEVENVYNYETAADYPVENKSLLNEDPLAFAVDVKGVIINGVYEPFKTYLHTLNGFDTPTLVAQNPLENLRPLSMAWSANKSVLYGLSREDQRELLRFNTETGVTTKLFGLSGLRAGQQAQGMAIDDNNQCYIIATDDNNHDTFSSLYTCNLATGRLTFVGSQSNAPDLHDIVASCDGGLYGIDSRSSSLYKLNKLNGQATLVGSTGLGDEKKLFTLAYDHQNDALYQYVLDESGLNTAFAKLNKYTGEATYVSEYFKHGVFVGAIESSCADQAETFTLNAGFNGAWYNPETSGQGLFFDMLPESNSVFAGWFTFNPTEESKAIGDSDQIWLTALGDLGESNAVELTVYNSTGGVFNNSAPVSSEAIGSLVIEFQDCAYAEVYYELNNQEYSGTFPIQRIAGDNLELCNSMLNSQDR